MKKGLKGAGLLLILAFTGYHSVYFKSLKEVKNEADGFNANAYASKFFQQTLLPMEDSAVQLGSLLSLLNKDKDAAFQQYGHALSIGSIQYFLVRGEGTVTAVNQNRVAVALAPDTLATAVNIATEFVFGNALRDASGKVSLSEFSNLSDINRISMELNKMVRTTVLPPFNKKVATDDTVRFYGAIELNSERLNLDQLEIIPIQLQLVPPANK